MGRHCAFSVGDWVASCKGLVEFACHNGAVVWMSLVALSPAQKDMFSHGCSARAVFSEVRDDIRFRPCTLPQIPTGWRTRPTLLQPLDIPRLKSFARSHTTGL
jgi:hypothetical protein